MSHKFYGGVHPAEHKEATERKPVIPLEEAPAQVVIPMSMHVGAPCKPIVAVGDEVTVGQKIGEIDLSGLDNLTAADMIQANKVLTNNGTVSVLPETTLEYDLIIAAGALKMPIEFFKQLKPKDAMALKNRVTSFLFGEE